MDQSKAAEVARSFLHAHGYPNGARGGGIKRDAEGFYIFLTFDKDKVDEARSKVPTVHETLRVQLETAPIRSTPLFPEQGVMRG